MKRAFHRFTASIVPILITALVALPAVAGTEESCAIDASAIGDDLADLITAPADWSTEEWLAAGAVGAVTAGLIIRWDEDIQRVSMEDPESFPYVIVHKLAWLGKWYGKNNINPALTFAAVTGGLFAIGKARDDDYLVRTTGIMTESYLFTAGFSMAFKLLLGRARPYLGDGARRWHFFGIHGRDMRSFPSGHTSGAFSMATALSKRHNEWWVQVPAYTLATGVASQRIDSGVHWTSDVLVGAVLGYAISAFLAERHTCTDPATGAVTPTTYINFGFNF